MTHIRSYVAGLVFVAGALPAGAQWINYPSPRTPLGRDGKPDLHAKAPRLNGKPDLSGVWQIVPPPPGEYERVFGDAGPGATAGDDVRTFWKYFFNMLADFPPGQEPILPSAVAQTAKNRTMLNDTPSSRCLPLALPSRYFNSRPFKIFQTADEIAMYYEVDGVFRQIHTDGRPLPKDPFPSWMGYSTGKWTGDTLEVRTNGFNAISWLDQRGHPHSEKMLVTERFHRRDFGHMDVETTVTDPEVLTQPVTVKFPVDLIPNSDILELYCVEGERDRANMTPPK
jgi:hypothetical protein